MRERQQLLGRKFVTARLCRGPKGCALVAHGPVCDRIFAEPGDACSSDHANACAVDGKAELECVDTPGTKYGVFAVARLCVGPEGCKPGHLVSDGLVTTTPWPHCDQSVATLGAACGKGDSNHRTCSADATTVLRCDSTTWTYVKETSCAPKGACVYVTEGHARGECKAGGAK